jgi:hypothetical protein
VSGFSTGWAVATLHELRILRKMIKHDPGAAEKRIEDLIQAYEKRG